jgi:hypothetical protein
MKGFTKCKNGHYYKEELPSCPYCHHGSIQTEAIDPKQETQLYTENKEESNTRFVIPKIPEQQSNRTVFGEDVVIDSGGTQVFRKEYRDVRKLVGWLVSYSFDRMGVDFRLYEGRNIVGVMWTVTSLFQTKQCQGSMQRSCSKAICLKLKTNFLLTARLLTTKISKTNTSNCMITI